MPILMAQRSLLIVTSVSWLFFPVMLKPLYPSVFILSFVLIFMLSAYFVMRKERPNMLELSRENLILAFSYGGYLFALLIATMTANVQASWIQFGITLIKVSLCIYLLFFIRSEFIRASMGIYANLMTVLSFLALLVFIYIELGGIPISMVNLNQLPTDVYWGAYSFHFAQPLFHNAGRLQGLTEEPGTFAFALLPAYFWLLLVKKAKIRFMIVGLALVFTLSVGAALFLLLVWLVLRDKYHIRSFASAAILMTISLTLLLFIIASKNAYSSPGNNMNVADKENRTPPTTTWAGKVQSANDRVSGLKMTLDYLQEHPEGAGSSLGIKAVGNSISVGYLIAAAESGVIGGICYIMTFVVIGWLALILIRRADVHQIGGVETIAVALSVCGILAMGAQRMQPDMSMWHMWLLAIFLHLQSKTKDAHFQMKTNDNYSRT